MTQKIISAKELNSYFKKTNSSQYTIIDVRTSAEFNEGHIANAINIELDIFTGNEEVLQNKERIFLICKGGVRAGKACARVPQNILEKSYILEGGMDSWIGEGFFVQKHVVRRFSIMQQMQIVVGGGVATGAILALTVNVKFAFISLFFGCGLLFAGLTGVCVLLKLLGKMPWNR